MPHIDEGTLHALMDGALRAHEPERADAVEAHLDACADCRARLEQAAALRDQAADVLAALDAGMEGGEAAPVPDFGEVMARAAASTDDAERGDTHSARLRRRLGWTRGLAWAATLVVALGTGYMIRDLAGPTGQVPRASREQIAPRPSAQADGGAESAELQPTAQQDGEPAEDAGPTTDAVADVAGGAAGGGREAPSEEPFPVSLGLEVAEEEAAEPAGPDPSVVQDLGAISNLAGEGEAAKITRLDTGVAQVVMSPNAVEGAGAAEADTRAAVAERLRQRAVQARTELQDAPSLASQPTGAAPTPGAVSAVDESGFAARVDPNTLAGCYRLEVGEWSPPRGEGDRPHQTPPERFELTDSVGPPAGTVEGRGRAATMEEGRLLLRPLLPPGHTPMGSPMGYWAPVPPDSVRLVWSNDFVGVSLRLAVRGDILEGRAVGISDAMGPAPPTAPARAVRVECPPR